MSKIFTCNICKSQMIPNKSFMTDKNIKDIFYQLVCSCGHREIVNDKQLTQEEIEKIDTILNKNKNGIKFHNGELG